MEVFPEALSLALFVLSILSETFSPCPNISLHLPAGDSSIGHWPFPTFLASLPPRSPGLNPLSLPKYTVAGTTLRYTHSTSLSIPWLMSSCAVDCGKLKGPFCRLPCTWGATLGWIPPSRSVHARQKTPHGCLLLGRHGIFHCPDLQNHRLCMVTAVGFLLEHSCGEVGHVSWLHHSWPCKHLSFLPP